MAEERRRIAEKPEDRTLTEASVALLAKLPDDIRPKVLHDEFPRIFNKISSMWRRPDSLIAYMEELLVDTRGDRQGFPITVALDLATLKDYYERVVHPDAAAPYLWDPRLAKVKPTPQRE
jgi:hypothetical protein